MQDPKLAPKLWQSALRLPVITLSILALALAASAQETEGETPPEEDIFELSPFVVTTSRDVGYLSTNSTSGTSLNTAIRDLPMAIQVINQDFITDIAASDLEESLVYAAGVFTDDNQASQSVGATRGQQGGGSGDRSISSAGQGSRFANVVYIRGLSTPYQNRMGFRYGGLVVTPNSEIALGGLLDSANIERIEVVKGPNSLLYGIGVLTGIVNVIPERPLSEPRYEFGIRAGNYDFLRSYADITGPVEADWIPGQLNYRLAGSYEERGNWTDFRDKRTEYWTAQIDYSPLPWARIFLEYQDGITRVEGIGAQWIYDEVNDANDTEFRNEFDEAYNWARHEDTLPRLRGLDPSGFNPTLSTVDDNGNRRTQPGFRLLDEAFVGGARGNDFRITGPDAFAERDEQNFIADLELYPIENMTINIGGFWSTQETFERTLQFNSATVGDPNNFVVNIIPSDSQLEGIWQSGAIFGVPMQPAVRDLFGLTARVDPQQHSGDYILPATTDDVKLTEYWWRDSVVTSDSEQYRVRATYSFDTPFIMGDARHTLLAGYSYIRDDINFPDGGINRGNARANRTGDFTGTIIDDPDDPGRPVENPYDRDGLYYRSIANFEPIYFDGRNDNVNGHNTVRAGDAYLNQEITQQGLYGVYQGKFLDDRLEVILGIRQDTYNARQLTYKRANVTDSFLRSQALAEVEKEALDTARSLAGGDEELAEQIAAQLVAENTADDRFITTWYRDSFESGDQGYFGYANRGGAPDETFGVVPGSEFDIFEEDVEVTTGTFGINFDITPEWTIYGLIAEGISPNTALRDGSGEIIPAEETLSREIGLKFELMEGKISGNVAFFTIDRKNAIWDVDYAPAAAKWLDAQQSPKRSNEWTVPTYDPATPTTYYVRGDYLVNYIADQFGINPERLNFAQQGDQIQQQVALGDLDPNLPVLDRLQIIRQVQERTLFPETFASQWSSQAPFGGNIQINVLGVNVAGLDDLHEITIYNPETNEFVTRDISNLPILYSAFMDRNLDKTKNELLEEIHPIRYRRFTSFGQPQENNNVDFDQAHGALVTFDEEINGFDLEIFLTPFENLQFVIGYTHVEREANDSFNFTEWESITGTEGTFIAPFTMLHREFGWSAAGMSLAWVDFDAYQSALSSSSDGVVTLDSLPDGAVDMVPAEQTDSVISNSEFATRSADGQLLLFVDERGDIVNEANSARATDYSGLLTGVSLNFNPEDELSVFGKYTFRDINRYLDNLSVTAGFKYIGQSKTSVRFNSVSPLSELTVTPEVGERFRFDVGASYRWFWDDVEMRFSLNIQDIFEDTYDVTTTTLDTRNPVTGEQVTKRTEKFYSPTVYRVGLSASF